MSELIGMSAASGARAGKGLDRREDKSLMLMIAEIGDRVCSARIAACNAADLVAGDTPEFANSEPPFSGGLVEAVRALHERVFADASFIEGAALRIQKTVMG